MEASFVVGDAGMAARYQDFLRSAPI